MPQLLFTSNSISHFPGSEVKSADWCFDSSRVPYAIYAPPATVVAPPQTEPSTSGQTWLHMRYGADEWHVNPTERVIEMLDANANSLLSFTQRDASTEGYRVTIHTESQTGTANKFLPMANQQLRTLDLQLIHENLTMEANLYLNEMLVVTVNLSQTSARVPVLFFFGGMTGNNADRGLYFSEVIISDTDTRNARLDLLRPVSGGVYGNFDGPIASLADDDPTTGMTTLLPDQKQSTILSPYGGANNISNVVQTTTTVRGINSPEKLRHFLRMSGVDHETADFDVPFTKDFQVTDWPLNPATSQPWEAGDLVDMEFGFESKA